MPFLARKWCILLMLLALCSAGCGGSKQPPANPAPPPAHPQDYSSRLNDPNVSEYEKEQIRKAMGQSGNAPTFGNPAPAGSGQ
ncbi:MAG: hypothetical protein RMJ43_14405 [Chloroherpetonaceae bacterium]|nr:hypothetical protein [Chthonomonadaceae bacterium]MDW8209023.1 hypothetical protein [Chloroherpetonaceae bacterium]